MGINRASVSYVVNWRLSFSSLDPFNNHISTLLVLVCKLPTNKFRTVNDSKSKPHPINNVNINSIPSGNFSVKIQMGVGDREISWQFKLDIAIGIWHSRHQSRLRYEYEYKIQIFLYLPYLIVYNLLGYRSELDLLTLFLFFKWPKPTLVHVNSNNSFNDWLYLHFSWLSLAALVLEIGIGKGKGLTESKHSNSKPSLSCILSFHALLLKRYYVLYWIRYNEWYREVPNEMTNQPRINQSLSIYLLVVGRYRIPIPTWGWTTTR
jgi:hypothetical protein